MNLKNKFNKKLFLINTLKAFIALNIVCFSYIVINTANQPYHNEKAMMQSSAFITVLYIIPLSKVFGNHNILTIPFYAVRDNLYNTAYNMYPKDEAEKEIQWYAVKGIEYQILYDSLYLRYYHSNPEKLANNKELWRWTDELYNNAMLLANEKTDQAYFNKYIYRNYIGELSQYMDDRPLLFLARDNSDYKNLLNDQKEIDRFNNILVTSERLRNNFQKNNPESLNYFLANNNITPQEFLNKYEALVYLLANKDLNHNFNCNDTLIEKYIDTKNEMINYLKNPPPETVKTTNIETTNGDLYKWELNIELEQIIETQCNMR